MKRPPGSVAEVDRQGLHLNLSLPEISMPVHGDPIRLAQALGNLLENALKYTPPNSPLEISARQDANAVVVSVSDHGPGLADATRRRHRLR